MYRNEVRKSDKQIPRMLLSLLLCFPLFVQAQTQVASPEQRLDSYLQLLTHADAPTSAELIKPASAFWLKGVHSDWVSVSRYLALHRPSRWTFSDQVAAGDYMSLKVQFSSRNSATPWITEFELVKAHNLWKITAFSSITQRALDDQTTSAQSLLETYLKQAQQAIKAIHAEQDKSEKDRLEKYYGSGAGYWDSVDIQSRMFLLWLKQKSPNTYQITDDSTTKETGSVTVTFHGVKHHPNGYPIRFEVIRKQQHLFIASYHDIKREKQKAETDKAVAAVTSDLNQVTANSSTPEATVRSQLEILQTAGKGSALYAVMPKIAEQSKPLWTSSRKARASLGRLVGVYAGLNSPGTDDIEWAFSTEDKTVTASISNLDALGSVSALLKGVRFTLVQQSDGWKIDQAVIFRD